MTVIFEGKDLVVHEIAGDTDYAVITFEGADQAHRATSDFFAKRPLEANNVKSIGVTAKSSEWFISDESDRVIELINQRLLGVGNRIVIGYSMGGYPALNWSCRLMASTVFAMCPKFSLDPEICAIEQGYVDRYLSERMKGMKIVPENVAGRIFIAYDPGHAHDTYHAKLIKERLEHKGVTLLKSFNAQHSIPDTIKGRDKVKYLVEALAYQGHADICRAYSVQRRTSQINLINNLRRGLFAHPVYSYGSLVSHSVFERACLKAVFSEYRDLAILSHRLSERGEFEKAIICRNLPFLYARHGADLTRDRALESSTLQLSCSPLTFHGHILSYSFEDKKLVGQDLLEGRQICPHVRFQTSGARLFIEIQTGNETAYLYEQDKRFLVSDTRRDSGLKIEKSLRNHHHHIKTPYGYLCAFPGGEIILDTPNRLEWEEFSIPALWS